MISLSLGHLFDCVYGKLKGWPSDKLKENFEIYLKVPCYAVFIKLQSISMYGIP